MILYTNAVTPKCPNCGDLLEIEISLELKEILTICPTCDQEANEPEEKEEKNKLN